MEKNTYDNATDEDIRANVCSPLSLDALMANIGRIAADNGIEASYKASVREYSTFKARAGQTIINQANE